MVSKRKRPHSPEKAKQGTHSRHSHSNSLQEVSSEIQAGVGQHRPPEEEETQDADESGHVFWRVLDSVQLFALKVRRLYPWPSVTARVFLA